MYRDYNARLASKLDWMKQKLIDNQEELIGTPTDCIRIRYKKNDEGDIISRIIEKADVVSIVFPPLKDVPYRTLDDDTGSWRITSLVNANADEFNQNYEIIAPHNKDLRVGDMIFRVFVDQEMTKPVVLGLNITESLATFGQNAIIQHKYKAAIYTEDLPKEMIDVIINMAQRRLKLKF